MPRVTVTLDQVETTFELHEESETILATAIAHGLDAPYSCRGGVCTTCMARLLEGRVKMDANYALTDKEIDDGFILACQSHPSSEVVRMTWDL